MSANEILQNYVKELLSLCDVRWTESLASSVRILFALWKLNVVVVVFHITEGDALFGCIAVVIQWRSGKSVVKIVNFSECQPRTGVWGWVKPINELFSLRCGDAMHFSFLSFFSLYSAALMHQHHEPWQFLILWENCCDGRWSNLVICFTHS